MNVKVLHILGPLRPSGMERMLLSGSRYFKEQGVSSWVLGQGAEHPFQSELESAGYKVQTCSSAARSWNDFLRLRKFVQEVEFDVIHIHTEGNYLRTVLASRFALGRHGSIVRTVHNVFAAGGMWRLRRLLQGLVADRFVRILIAPSPDVAENEKANLRRMKVIYNWVDDSFLPLRNLRAKNSLSGQTAPKALIVGNCSRIKNHEQALGAVCDSDHLLIHLGDERESSAAEREMLDELQNSNRLVRRGVQQPLMALMEADCFLMSSRHEGMPVALAEALVAGVPAVVSDAPGLRWSRGLEGVIMLPDDDAAWTNALMTRAYAVANGTPAPMPDFSASRGAHRYAEVYRSLRRARTGSSLPLNAL